VRKSCFVLLLVSVIFSVVFSVTCHAEDYESVVTAVYISESKDQLTAHFNKASDTVTLVFFDNSTLILPAVKSDSGACFSNGDMTFREHDGTATLYDKENFPLFSGIEMADNESEFFAPTATKLADNSSMIAPVAEYANQLKENDESFGNPGMTDSMEYQFDAGEGKPPITAQGRNVIDSVYVSGNWASVEFVITADDKNLQGLPVMADGTLYFLMKKNAKGAWQGKYWFLGSMPPCLTKEEAKASEISHDEMTSLGWMIDPEGD